LTFTVKKAILVIGKYCIDLVEISDIIKLKETLKSK